MRILVLVAFGVLISSTAWAQDQSEKESVTEAVNMLSNCSGYYAFLADLAENGSKPEAAEQLRGAARGAKFSAAYMLSIEASAKGRSRKLGEFNPYVDSVAELNKNRLMGLLELEDDSAIKEQGEICKLAMELQKTLVQELRDQMIDR